MQDCVSFVNWYLFYLSTNFPEQEKMIIHNEVYFHDTCVSDLSSTNVNDDVLNKFIVNYAFK